MKKFIIIQLFLIFSLFANSQNLKASVSAGTFTLLNKSELKWSPMITYGIQFYERFGIEYGRSIKLNKSLNDYNNYINGRSLNYEAARVTRIYGLFYIPKNSPINIGAGLAHSSVTKTGYNDLTIKDEYHPFIKFGLSEQINNLIGVSINMNFGTFYMANVGLSFIIQ